MTITSPVSLSRRHVLGDLYSRCIALTDEIPVYLEGDDREVLGHANQQLGVFADAISFFLSEGNCRKLVSGGFRFAVDYDNSTADSNVNSRQVVITSITLLAPKNYEKPVPRHG